MNIKELKNNEELKTYIECADNVLKSIGYTEHSFQHVNTVSNNAKRILRDFGFSKREQDLVEIAGFMHDIGNVVNRYDHANNGAILAHQFLTTKTDLPIRDILEITSAIGNHDEGTAYPINPMTAALIIADKSDARRNRVRNKMGNENIHYRVNYSVVKSELLTNPAEKTISLNLTIDTDICSVMEYFEIFLERTKLCIKSAKVLGADFELIINGQKLT